MGLFDSTFGFINIIILNFAFLSLFAQRKLEPGDGSNELPAGSPLFSSEKKEKKKIPTLHPNHNTNYSRKVDEGGGVKRFQLFSI